jgi:transcription initiation factor IIE alpha subunit
MLQTTERYTPAGVAQMINGYKKQLNELHDKRVAAAHRKQSEHPSYMKMTEKEFKQYIIDYIRWNLKKADEIKEKIKKLENLRF